MTFADLLDEYVTLRLEGEPESGDWVSISESRDRLERYRARLEELKSEINAALAAARKESP